MRATTRHLLQVGLTTNIVEWYEFIVFAYLAKIMGKVFFSTEVASLALINTFAVITTSYMARPIGGIFWGYIGDKHSPQQAIRYSIILMAVPTIIIGMLPTYQQIGIFSPFCLIILRLVQGFAAGGEYPGSASYIYNKSLSFSNSPLLCSLPLIGSMSGVLLASFIVYLLYSFFNQLIILEWAWRLPFLLSVPLLLFILRIRRDIPNIEPVNTIISQKYLNKIYIYKFITAFVLAGFLEIIFYILLVH